MHCSRSLGGGSPGPQLRGKLREIWSRPTAKGDLSGGGACSGGGCLLWGVSTPGGACSGGGGGACCGDPPSPVTATAAGGTHPTGMHSCLTFSHTSPSFASEIVSHTLCMWRLMIQKRKWLIVPESNICWCIYFRCYLPMTSLSFNSATLIMYFILPLLLRASHRWTS